MEVPESVADSFDAFDVVVEGFGRSVTGVCQVVVDDLAKPGCQGPTQALDLGWHGWFEAMCHELGYHLTSLARVGMLVEVRQAFFDLVGDCDLPVGIS